MGIVDDRTTPEVAVTGPYFDGDTFEIGSGGLAISLRPPLGHMGWTVCVEQAFSPGQIPNLIACLHEAGRIAGT